ncbi:deoxyribose-phosphate aldolase [Ruminococcaceae bacterium OttesenSCG-928-O06]|nr:deoxyribose-phosphate aldolase [Ruminococcaceae bacterium OttesenSCG-928-O06]
MTRNELAKTIDHTILKAEATRAQVEETILYARGQGTASVCLNPCWVPLAADLLAGSGVAVCTVIGFPLGATTSYAKAKETEAAREQGAAEMDMVLNIGALKSGMEDYVLADIKAVVHASDALVKVILETCYLTDAEIAAACRLAAEAGATFVKTSTGFGPQGATAENVRLMRQSIPLEMQVKAAGGIGTLQDALAMLDAGASRIGASRTAAILDALDAQNAR